VATPTRRLNAQTTAEEIVSDLDLTGRRIIVTGATSGIGRETARVLASRGANVTLAVRRLAAGERVARELSAETRRPVRAARLDLSDRRSIADFVDGWAGPLDVLINNAGVMALPELQHTESGWEMHYATNHLGPAELTLDMAEALRAGDRARVVNVSSAAHLISPVDLEDPHFEKSPYEAWTAYARSKTAMILFTVALAKRWEPDGITVNAVHPGGVVTELLRHLDEAQMTFVGARDEHTGEGRVPDGWKTLEQGAATTVLVAASPTLEGVTGRYFEDCQLATLTSHPVPGGHGVARYAVDPRTAKELWNHTLSALRG
jgi:NAD(P)-dependent dehydrogenase (short-subunit alcohol dehydrogenase family)